MRNHNGIGNPMSSSGAEHLAHGRYPPIPWRALLPLMFLAPMFGSAFDHHFAERVPMHGHVGAPALHIHPFESPHAEAKRLLAQEQQTEFLSAMPKADGRLYLLPRDSWEQGPAFLSADPLLANDGFLSTVHDGQWSAATPTTSFWTEVPRGVLLTPPRGALFSTATL